MTISTTTRTVTHNGNGVAVNFTYPFKIDDAADLLVYLKSGSVFVLKTLGTDYHLTGARNPGGGTVTFVVAPASATGNVRFLRRTALTQLVDYITNDDFPAEIHEAALDKLTMAVQDYMGDSLTLDATADYWDAKSKVIKNVADPVDPQDAATKAYGEANWGGTAAADAAASAASAAAAASSAATASTAATNSASAAANSATQAANSAASAAATASSVTTASTAATNSASAAANSATQAVAAASAATSAATNSASAAANSATQAANSAASAASAAAAASSVTTAATAATNSASAAANSATQAANSAASAAAAASSVTNVPTRQTVLSGPLDASGFPSFLPATSGSLSLTSQNITSGTPLVVTSANGFSTNGADDRIGSHTANLTWAGLAASSTNYLYVDIAADGSLTPGSTTLAPNYQFGGARSTTNGQATFNIQEMWMTVGNGASAVVTRRVFVGEANTNASTVTATRAYAYQGRYWSGWTNSLPSASTLVSRNHNLGVSGVPLKGKLTYKCLVAEYGYSVGDIIETFADYTSGFNWNNKLIYSGANTVGYMTSNNSGGSVATINKSNGAAATLSAANWAYQIQVDRPF